MSTLRRIGGPNAITAWSYWLSLAVLLVVTMLPSERDRFIGTLGERMLLAGLGTAAGFTVLALASVTVLRPHPGRARPWTAFGVFAMVGVVQGVAIIGMRDALGLPPVQEATLIVTRAIAGAIWLSVIAIVVDQARSHAARVAELQARIAVVERAAERDEDDLRVEVERMRRQVLEPIHRALDDIGARLAVMGGTGAAEAEARSLRRLVDDEVRPLSHRLLGDVPVQVALDAEIALPARRQRLLTVWRMAVTTVASPVWLAVLLPMALILLFAIQSIGVVFLLASASTYLVVVGTLFAGARAMLDPRLPRMSTTRAAVLVLAVYEGLAVVAVVNGWAWGGLSRIGPWIEWPALVTLPVVWLALAIFRAGERERQALEDGLRDALERMEVVTTRRRQRIRHERQVLGRLLHGSTQATLLSVEARLAQSVDDGDTHADVEIATAELAALRHRLSAPVEEPWHVRAALADVVDMWRGVLEIRLSAEHGVLNLLDGAPATRTAVVDVVAEGLTNAVRHGAARAADVHIGMMGGDRIEVRVSDDGTGARAGSRGMGSDLFDGVTCGWSLEAGESGSVLRASVALDVAPARAP